MIKSSRCGCRGFEYVFAHAPIEFLFTNSLPDPTRTKTSILFCAALDTAMSIFAQSYATLFECMACSFLISSGYSLFAIAMFRSVLNSYASRCRAKPMFSVYRTSTAGNPVPYKPSSNSSPPPQHSLQPYSAISQPVAHTPIQACRHHPYQ
jgi:hypothetical protein